MTEQQTITEPITVLLADDHSLVRRGFRRLLEDDESLKVVGEASTGVEAIRMAQELKPKVVVMDLSMPDLDGVQAPGKSSSICPAPMCWCSACTPKTIMCGTLSTRELRAIF